MAVYEGQRKEKTFITLTFLGATFNQKTALFLTLQSMKPAAAFNLYRQS